MIQLFTASEWHTHRLRGRERPGEWGIWRSGETQTRCGKWQRLSKSNSA